MKIHRSTLRHLSALHAAALCLLSAASSLVAKEARAEPAAEEAPDQVVPPRPLSVAVSYPKEATGNASVSLSFVVDIDGTVKDVEVDVGDEPFASAAIAASTGWSFVPASVGGVPAAVRIAMEVQFTQERLPAPPAPPPAPRPDGRPAPLEPAAPGEAEPGTEGNVVATIQETAEVTVAGQRPPGATTLSRAEARQIPGALGDPIRAVDTMAGVSPLVSGLPVFYLRGAPPGNIGFYVDEIRLPFLFHAFLGPSVVNSELIERVNLYSSWYPARFGGFAGGVVETELRAPRHERTISLGLGLWEAGAFVESPFAADRGTIFIGGRYAFTGLLLSALTPNTIEYWNYQALADYELGPNDRARVFLLGAFDYFEDEEQSFLGTEFHRLDLRVDHRFSKRTLVYGGATLGIDRTRFSQARVIDRSAALRLRVNHQADPQLLLRAGIDGGYDVFDLSLDATGRLDDYLDIQELFPARDDMVFGGFTDAVWQPRSDITVVPGVRANVYRSGNDMAVGLDPQVSARLGVTPDVAAVHSVGVSHQTPNYIPTIPGVRVAGLEGGLQQSIHASSGVEVALAEEWKASVVGFDNVFVNLTDPFSLTQEYSLDPEISRRRSLGHAYGVELEVRRPLTRRFGALLTYTLSHSTRSHGRVETVAGSDRTHVINLAGMYTLGKNWRVGARSVFYSGIPGRLDREQDETGNFRSTERFPYPRANPFFRLDLRLERRFRLGPRSWWSLIAEGLNVTASKETLRRSCNEVTGCTDRVVGPIFLPNVKIEAQF